MLEIATKVTEEVALATTPEKLGLLVRECKKLPQVDCPLTHGFQPGVYMRQMAIPAGTVVISMKHLTTHKWALVQGRIAIWTEDDGAKILQAPVCGVTPAGAIRIGLAITDTVWVAYYDNAENEFDIAALEARLGSDPEDILKESVSLLGE